MKRKGINFSIKTIMVMAITVAVLSIIGLMVSTQLTDMTEIMNGSIGGTLTW
jgi:hypothetical protein